MLAQSYKAPERIQTTISEKKPPVLILLAVGSDLDAFVLNALASLRKVEPDIQVQLWCDGKSGLKDLDNHHLSVRILEEEFGQFPYSAFGTPMFNFVTNLKWTIVQRALSEGHELVIFSDVDVVFLEPIIPYVSRVARTTGVGMQTENLSSFPPEFCTGFMFFSQSGIKLVTQLEAFAQANEFDCNDQVMLRKWLPLDRLGDDKIYELNGALFPNGKMARGLVDASDVPAGFPEPPRPFIFHANWVAGIEAKKEMLQRLGFWFL